jgi:transcription antitermination factor NusG
MGRSMTNPTLQLKMRTTEMIHDSPSTFKPGDQVSIVWGLFRKRTGTITKVDDESGEVYCRIAVFGDRAIEPHMPPKTCEKIADSNHGP